MERDLVLVTKAHHILEGTVQLVHGIISRENPDLDPYWALDEIATRLKELTSAFEKKEGKELKY